MAAMKHIISTPMVQSKRTHVININSCQYRMMRGIRPFPTRHIFVKTNILSLAKYAACVVQSMLMNNDIGGVNIDYAMPV